MDCLQEVGWLRGAAVMCGSACVVAGVFCVAGWSWGGGLERAGCCGRSALDVSSSMAPMILLTVWLLREMRPMLSRRVICWFRW